MQHELLVDSFQMKQVNEKYGLIKSCSLCFISACMPNTTALISHSGNLSRKHKRKESSFLPLLEVIKQENGLEEPLLGMCFFVVSVKKKNSDILCIKASWVQSC